MSTSEQCLGYKKNLNPDPTKNARIQIQNLPNNWSQTSRPCLDPIYFNFANSDPDLKLSKHDSKVTNKN